MLTLIALDVFKMIVVEVIRRSLFFVFVDVKMKDDVVIRHMPLSVSPRDLLRSNMLIHL